MVKDESDIYLFIQVCVKWKTGSPYPGNRAAILGARERSSPQSSPDSDTAAFPVCRGPL